jgi:uncharacterized repeat protein (TIGR01451 family)
MGAFGGQALASDTIVELPSKEDMKKGLQVKKSAHSYHAAYWKWDVEKTPSTRVGYNHENHHVKVGYKVTATPKVVKTGSHTVYGKIYMHNPSERRPIGILHVDDALHGEDGAYCEMSGMHGGSNGDTTAQEVSKVLGVIPPGSGAYVEYKCAWDGEPSKRSGKNKAVVKWAYGPRDNPESLAPLAVADEAEMVKVKETHAYAPYDFAKGEIENRGYTAANVYDKMGDGRPELLGEHLSALDGVWTKSYYKYLRAPRKVNECIRIKNRAILVGKKAEAEQNAVVVRSEWGKVHADAYVKICTKEKKPSSEDPAPPDVVVTEGSSEDPRPTDPRPEKPADVKPSNFDPKPPSSEDPRPGKGKLHVNKRANKRVAYMGSRVVWTVRVKNKGNKTLRNVHLKDVLPKYFRVERERTRRIMGRKNGVAIKRRAIHVKIGHIRPGQTRTLRIATRVVGRPMMTKPVRQAASKKRGKARRAYIARMKRGIACNVVIVRAKGTRDRDRACVRVMKPKEGPPNDKPSEENGEAGAATT